ncbi:4-oxalocrotonate decarboxylase [Neobacillus bataviensis LMG 21833]|uniref:4-oxalocrotonate decarboxylase n=1 Tax=Neobacillus bataviensis LMG 21833 TaxID=1117379 RepID=K6D3K8_9BACI|nr:fumarylacetoacetate hydrolase family protein [Neobacillus bataviensis]EKN62628.1 4-oxalocrotonate decarboxylase [Neobacillus bataviensis LMG 21833]
MTLLTNKNKEIIEYLYAAERDVREVIKVTDEYPELTVKDAYELQDGLLARKLVEAGTKTVGVKLGLTSKAKQVMMGVNEAIYGYLHNDMLAFEWEAIRYSELIHPKVEPEIAFLLGKDLQGENITEEDVLDATQYVAPALEVIDSRYKDFRFTLVDVVADNCSSAKFVVGSKWISPSTLDLGNVGMVMSKNGEVAQTGSSAAVLGHPATAIAWAVNELGARGKGLKKGDIILSGAITEAIAFKPGDSVIANFEGLGSVSMYCK